MSSGRKHRHAHARERTIAHTHKAAVRQCSDGGGGMNRQVGGGHSRSCPGELLTEYSMVPLGLWNDMRLPSFFSGVFFWPVSESKRGKVRITFMFLCPPGVSPAAVSQPRGSTAHPSAASKRASERGQPASDVSCKPPDLFLSFPLSLPPSLSVLLARSASITLSSLSLSLSPSLLLDAAWSNDSCRKRFTLLSSSCCLLQRTEITLTSIEATALPTPEIRWEGRKEEAFVAETEWCESQVTRGCWDMRGVLVSCWCDTDAKKQSKNKTGGRICLSCLLPTPK